MVASPCKNCPKKNLPKERCIKDCQILKAIQEMDLSSETLNEGCGIDYTLEYGYHIPTSHFSNHHLYFSNFNG